MIKRLLGGLFAMAALALLMVLPADRTEAQGSFGTNWVGTFYPSTDFTGTPASVNYPNGLNFNWPTTPLQPTGVPVPGFESVVDNFSARFTSQQSFAQAGNYQFFGFVDDQIIVFINNQEVYRQTTPGNFSFTVNLQAGAQAIRVDFIELTSTAVLQFQWQLAGGGPPGGPGPVPGVTSTPAAPTGPTGQVVNVRGLSLRTGPYLGASFITAVRPGTAFPVLARNSDEGGGFTWYRIQAGDQVGWVSGRYFTVTGDVPEEGTVFQQLDNPPSTGVIAVPNAFMNFRVRPSVRSQRFDQIPWGAEVEVLGRTVQGGRNHWLLVRYDGRVGWAYAPYFRVRRGFIETVPVY